MEFKNIQLIDNRFIYTAKSNNKYIVTVDYRQSNDLNKPLLKIGLCRDPKIKKRMFESDYMVKEFLEKRRKYKILKISGKQVNCLLDTTDLKTTKFDDDFKEIKSVFKKYYTENTNRKFEDFDIKLIYDGVINYAINMFKTSWTIVIDPSLKGKISYNKLKRIVLRNNTNRNLEIKVRFQHGKYVPKTIKEEDKEKPKEELKVKAKKTPIEKDSPDEDTEEVKIKTKKEAKKSSIEKDSSEENIEEEGVKRRDIKEIKGKKQKRAIKKEVSVSSESDEDLKLKTNKRRAPKKKVSDVLE